MQESLIWDDLGHSHEDQERAESSCGKDVKDWITRQGTGRRAC
jgi:hypothetical protein